MIYIVIPVFNRWNFTKACLECLADQTYKNFRIVVVDHGSGDGTRELIQKEYPWVILLLGDSSMWWTGATNYGIETVLKMSKSNNDFILTLNNDVEVEESYLDELITVYSLCKPCLVGSTSVDIKNPESINFIGGTWNERNAKYKHSNLVNSSYNDVRKTVAYVKTDLLPGRGVLIPIEVFKKVGWFDSINFPHYGADDDFSLRCSKYGYKLVVSTKGVVKSHVNESQLNKMSFFNYLKFNLFSIKSPNRISTRIKWAQKHAPIPLVYFFFDVIRIVGSLFKENLIRLKSK